MGFKPRQSKVPPGKHKDLCPLGDDCIFFHLTFGKATRHSANQAKDCTRAAGN